MFCKNCGTSIANTAKVCPICGTAQTTRISDEGGFLWGVLGCCIPIVGLVLFLVWHDEKPKTAKAAGMGALISVGSIALYYVFILLFGLGVSVLW